MTQRIALFGGTFDPIHNGHIELANEFVRRLSLDRVVIMPTFVPPHKIKPTLSPAVDRLEMCRLACQPYPQLTVSDMEINRRGASFTVDTLRVLHTQYPDAALYLLVGADMFLTLATWKDFAEIARLAVLCTAPRDEVTLSQLNSYAALLTAQGAQCVIEEMPLLPYSSTAVREALQRGASAENLVPPSVAAYIQQHRLYTEQAEYRNADEQYTDIIKGRLTPRRFAHSLAVAAQAEHLATIHGGDVAKAKTAGLLHDILKDTDGDSQLQICKDFGILLDIVTQSTPKLWHACAGAVFIEQILGVTDRDILNAVRYHTTGRAGMSLLEMLVYMADFTSADRDFPDVGYLRELADRDLNAAMAYALAYTIEDLQKQNRTVHPDTLACYREILEKTEGA